MSKLALYAQNFSIKQSACQYYRIVTPMLGMEKLGYAESFVDRGVFNSTNLTIPIMLSSDINLSWGITGEQSLDMVRTIENMNAGFAGDGVTRVYPPSVVYDIDDNSEYTHPFNPMFYVLGTRNVDGKQLNPGDDILTQLPDGSIKPLWEDKKTMGDDGRLFDIERNLRDLKATHEIARVASGVTVPCKPLADYFKNVIGVKDVYVFPNTIMEEDYEFPRLMPRTDGSVRIFWQGGDSHYQDFYAIKDAFKEVAKKYPNVVFVVWGSKYDWLYDSIPEKQLEFHGWVPYEAYKYKKVLLDVDINLAPLIDNVFNKCKSAIKWYEASVGTGAVPTLASNFGPYKEITDGETGLLYNTPTEFVQKLGKLIEDASLRKKLAENARKWVLDNRSIKATIPGLNEFYQELRRKKKFKEDNRDASI